MSLISGSEKRGLGFMAGLSVSFKTSSRKTNLNHNNRTLTDEEKKQDAHSHIDFTKSHENIYIKQQSLEDAYDELFGEALEKYNAKQKRSDRKIGNYLQKVKKDGNLDVQREFIVQLGDMEIFNESEGMTADGAQNNRELFGELLTEYVDQFQERNPRLHVYNAVVHMDEASPHLHLNVIPVADGYKRGLEVQPSFSKALANQGISSTGKHQFIDFRNAEVAELEKVLHSVGAERKEVGTNDFQHIAEYKEYRHKIGFLKGKERRQREMNKILEEQYESLGKAIVLRKKELEDSPQLKELDQKIATRKTELTAVETDLATAENKLVGVTEKVGVLSEQERKLEYRIEWKRGENDEISKTWNLKNNKSKADVQRVIANAQPQRFGSGMVIDEESFELLRRVPARMEDDRPFANLSAEVKRLRKRETEQNQEIDKLQAEKKQLVEKNKDLDSSLYVANVKYKALEARVGRFVDTIKELAQNNKAVSFIRNLGYRARDTDFENQLFDSFSDDQNYVDGRSKRIADDMQRQSQFRNDYDMEL